MTQKQHYVPRVLLLQHGIEGDRGRLFIFDKNEGRQLPGPMKIEKLCKEGGFYDAQAAHGQVSLEEAFHPLEEAYGLIAPKLIQQKSLACLSEVEFGALIAFVCVQFLRVPRMRQAFKQISEIMIAKAREIASEAKEIRDYERVLEQNELRLRHFKSIATGTVAATSILSDYAWFMMEASDATSFWISDCPVVLHNDEEGIYAGLGLAAPGVPIYLPLNSKLLLVCWHPIVAGRFIKEYKTSCDLIARLKAQCSRGMRADRGQIEATIAKLEKAAEQIAPIINAIKFRGSASAQAEQVQHVNWLQFQWSHRFVMCAKDDLTEAALMLERFPQLRSGISVQG